MNVLMLRGQVPQDRNPREIMYDSLEEETDVWTHLAMAMGDRVEVAYWGGYRIKCYTSKKLVVFYPDFTYLKTLFEPDIIFARGGFPQYHPVLKRYPKAFKIYYGAGKRHLPLKGFTDYNLTLQDSENQLNRARKKFPGIKHVLWTKPVPPQFYPRKVDKEFDVCYIANGPQAKIKRIPWVYRTAPKDLKILHLGLPSKYKAPPNITCKRVLKEEMPEWISKCRVGVVPYTRVDSAPRALSEMMACGLIVITSKDVNCAGYHVTNCNKTTVGDFFWDRVRSHVKYLRNRNSDNSIYLSRSRTGTFSVREAADRILGLVNK